MATGQRIWPYLVPALVLSVVYGSTVQRSTGNTFSVDTTKFDYLGLVLGTAHPPGYPLYTMLNAIFVRVVPFGSVALRANLLSAVFAVCTCLVLVGILRRLSVRRELAASGAVVVGLLPDFWRWAVVAEVYTLTGLFLVLVLACVLNYEVTGRRGWLRAGVLVLALSFSHATSNVLLVPGLLLYLVARRVGWLFRWREVAVLLPSSAALALLPYAYLPWRTAARASFLDTRVTDLGSFIDVVSGARYVSAMFGVAWPEVLSVRLPQLWQATLAQFGPLVLCCALGFVVLLLRRQWVVAVLLALWALAIAGFVVSYDVPDWRTMLLPLWIVLALFGLVGLDAAVTGLARSWAQPVAVLVALALPITLLVAGYRANDRSGPNAQAPVDAALAAMPDDSIVFTSDHSTRHQFLYRLLPEEMGARRNIWTARGRISLSKPDPYVHQIVAYCRPGSAPWVWTLQEQQIAPAVPRGLHVYVYGKGYAGRVRAAGLHTRHVSGLLWSVSCPSSARR